MEQSLKHVLCYFLILIPSQPNNNFAANDFRDTPADSAEDQVLRYIFLLPHRSQFVSYLRLLFFPNITRFISDFRNFVLLGFYSNQPVCFWPVDRQWFFYPILSDKSHVLTAPLYHTSHVYFFNFPSQSVGDVIESISPSGSDDQRKAFLNIIRQHIRRGNVFSIFQVSFNTIFTSVRLIIYSVLFYVAIARWQVPIALLPMARSFSVTKSSDSV